MVVIDKDLGVGGGAFSGVCLFACLLVCLIP